MFVETLKKTSITDVAYLQKPNLRINLEPSHYRCSRVEFKDRGNLYTRKIHD